VVTVSESALRNCKSIKCDAFYANCLRNKAITWPKGHVIALQFLKGPEQEELKAEVEDAMERFTFRSIQAVD
jgi:hypothetical protein